MRRTEQWLNRREGPAAGRIGERAIPRDDAPRGNNRRTCSENGTKMRSELEPTAGVVDVASKRSRRHRQRHPQAGFPREYPRRGTPAARTKSGASSRPMPPPPNTETSKRSELDRLACHSRRGLRERALSGILVGGLVNLDGALEVGAVLD